MKVEITRKKDGDLKMHLLAPKIHFEAKLTAFESVVESQFFLMPLQDDNQYYFANKKKFGIPTRGEYWVDGQQLICGNNDCLTLYDNGRGHFHYHTNWYWASMQTRIGETIVALNFGDGIGVEKSNPSFYEDFISINGSVFKLDQTVITYDEKDFMKGHIFVTAGERVFKERYCNMTFTPLGVAKDGLHLGVIGMIQYLVYGFWSGECKVEGIAPIAVEKALGTVEHVRARW